MLSKYSQFILIKEGSYSLNDANPVYWDNEDFKNLFKHEWSELKTEKIQSEYYRICFNSGEGGKYPYYSVLIHNKGGKETLILEDKPNDTSNVNNFINKLKTEFEKNPNEYIKNFKYDPKCLGDIGYARNSNKFNM